MFYGPGPAADFRGADLAGAKLKGADLRYAMFDCKTRWPSGFTPSTLPLFPVSSPECPELIKTALFTNTGMVREMAGRTNSGTPKQKGPEFRQQNFSEINLSGANLSGFLFWKVKFVRANLMETDFRNGSIQDSDFSDADLRKADFRGAILWDSNFSSAELDGASFQGAWYNARTVWPNGFDPVKAGALMK